MRWRSEARKDGWGDIEREKEGRRDGWRERRNDGELEGWRERYLKSVRECTSGGSDEEGREAETNGGRWRDKGRLNWREGRRDGWGREGGR